jgi:hypothetical protein
MEERKGRMEPRNQLIACVIKQYGTELYQAWVSLDKGHTACLGSHHDEAGATETIDRFLDVYQEGQIKTHKDILIHIDPSSAQDITAPLLLIGQSVGQITSSTNPPI